jgi:hypothetical protein
MRGSVGSSDRPTALCYGSIPANVSQATTSDTWAR